jgi:hypothetical protein
MAPRTAENALILWDNINICRDASQKSITGDACPTHFG